MRTLSRVLATVAAFTATAGYAATVDFESAPGSYTFVPPGYTYPIGGYVLGADGSAVTTQSTEQARSATHSIKMQMSNASPGSDFSKVTMGYNGDLGNTAASFWSFIPTSSSSNLAPYMYFIADANGNGVYDFGGVNGGDALVIAFITGGTPYPQNAWFQTGLDGSTNVHVVGNRSGLTNGTYSSSGTQDTLDNLSAMTFGSGTWGDMDVIAVRVGAGEWPGAANYTAYIDDILVTSTSSVPEIGSTFLLLGGALSSIGFLMRKKNR